ncbi:MAG: DUF6614 family protein [Hyphomicrobiales bacterium]
MIHMLSRFDLKANVRIEQFGAGYWNLVEHMKTEGLVEGSGKIGRREKNTPMDTDEERAPEYYVVMLFKDRKQLDDAYAYLSASDAKNLRSHKVVQTSILNPVFTCWRDVE